MPHVLYDLVVADALELVCNPPSSSEPLSHWALHASVSISSSSSGQSDTSCLWCGCSFTPRATGGSLLDGTSAGVLDRGASLDDAGDRDRSAIGRVPEGSPGQRARCAR